MKITRSMIITLEQVLTGMLETAMAPELAFQVASNAVSVSEVAESIRKSFKQTEGFEEYQEARGALLESIAGASPNGKYQLNPDQALEFNEKIKVIDLEHKDVLDANQAYEEEFNKMLEKGVEVEIQKIKIKEMTVPIEPAKMVVLIKSGIIDNGRTAGDV